MGQHGASRDLEWTHIPWPIKWCAYITVIAITVAVLAIVLCGAAWLIGHPLASQCHI